MEKVAFYACEENAHPILPKVCARFDIVGVSWAITKLPSINDAHVFRVSCTVPHSSHLISLLCAKPTLSCLSSLLSALPSLCCYKPLLAHKSVFSLFFSFWETRGVEFWMKKSCFCWLFWFSHKSKHFQLSV